jgi:hypothetical protein
VFHVTREQPTRPHDVPPDHGNDEPDQRTAPPRLTPAEEHAMRRSAPLKAALREDAADRVDGLRPL